MSPSQSDNEATIFVPNESLFWRMNIGEGYGEIIPNTNEIQLLSDLVQQHSVKVITYSSLPLVPENAKQTVQYHAICRAAGVSEAHFNVGSPNGTTMAFVEEAGFALQNSNDRYANMKKPGQGSFVVKGNGAQLKADGAENCADLFELARQVRTKVPGRELAA